MMAETQDAAAGALGERSPQPGRARAASFRVLLWKEWRQQRWTFLGMTALALGLFVLGGTLLRRWSFGLSGAAYLFALLGVPLVLSARAFAGEDEDGTAAFLRELPFRPLQVFWAKLLVVVLASWAAAGLLLLLGWLWAGYPDDVMRGIPVAVRHKAGHAVTVVRVGIWLLAPVTAALASLLASLCLRSLTTAMLSSVCLVLSVSCGAVSLFLLDYVAQTRGFVWALAAALVPTLGVLLAARLSARRHPRRLVQFGRGAGGAMAVAALWVVPGILSVLYVLVLATPEAYLRPTWWHHSLGAVAVSVPPTARPAAVLLVCEHTMLESTSLALLDPETGRTTWIERGMPCVPSALREGCWSTDGSRVVWQRRDVHGLERCLARLGIERNSLRREKLGPDGWAPDLFAYDLETQRTTGVPHEAWDGLLGRGLHWWYDATTILRVVVRQPGGPGMMNYLNTLDGTVHSRLLFPASTTAMCKFGTVVLPGRAAYVALWRKASPGAAEELVIARGTPDAAEATLLRVTEPPPRSARFRAVNPDERWGLFVTEDQPDCASRLDLVDLATGTCRRVDLPQDNSGLLDSQQWRWEPVLYSFPDAHRLVVSTRGLHAVYDLRGSTWQVYAPPSPDRPQARGDGWRASPDGGRFLQFYRADSGDALMLRVFDLHTVQWTVLTLGKHWYGEMTWYGNEHVLLTTDWGVSTLGLDGSREVLWPRK